MHPFPSLSELQFLVGKTVSEIGLGAHVTILQWWEGGNISIQGDLEHVDSDGHVYRYDNNAAVGPPLALHRLAQQKVALLDVEPFRLTLIFEDGQAIRLFTDEGPWERGLIQLTDELSDGYIVY